MTTPKNCAVIYRTGGTADFQWVRLTSLDLYHPRRGGQYEGRTGAPMGYPCNSSSQASLLNSIGGLPATFDVTSLNFASLIHSRILLTGVHLGVKWFPTWQLKS